MSTVKGSLSKASMDSSLYGHNVSQTSIHFFRLLHAKLGPGGQL